MLLRPLEPRDRLAVIAMRNDDLPPHRHETLSEWDAWIAIEPPEKVCRRFVIGDPPCAYLRVTDMNTTLMRHPGDCSFDLVVERTHRQQGLGAMLYDYILAFAEERGLRRLVTTFIEHSPDEPASAFLGPRGFVEMDRELRSSRDLSTFDPARFADALARVEAQGVRLLSYAAVPDTDANRRRLYALTLPIDRDMPTHDDVPYEDPQFDGWLRYYTHPEFDPRALILAELDGDWIGLTQLGFRQETGIGSTWTTGVLAPYRGRGLALAMKVHSLQAAQARGCPVVTTENHEDNAPMLAINRRLGFVPEPPQVRLQKPLRSE